MHQPAYADKAALDETRRTLSRLPGLVTPTEIRELRARLRDVQEGKAFYLQGGHCAETFAHCNAARIQPMVDVIDIMSRVLQKAIGKPVVALARMAGQYAKPRSSPTEVVRGVSMQSFKGDIINESTPTPDARTPRPDRMLEAYFRSAASLNCLRSASQTRLDRINPAMIKRVFQTLNSEPVRDAMRGAQKSSAFYGGNAADKGVAQELVDMKRARTTLSLGESLFVSHEGLLLEYEEPLTRRFDNAQGPMSCYFNCSTHMLWIGHRTRGLNDAHVEYFRGLANPVGVKVGPGTTADLLVKLISRLNPDDEPGKIILISRFGASGVRSALPALVDGVRKAGKRVIWVCDPMHGNTRKINGYKTRDFKNVLAEIVQTFQIHRELGSTLNGLHLEMCGEDVTECLGGPEKLTPKDLPRCFDTACDPRLNFQQSLALAFACGAVFGKGSAASQATASQATAGAEAREKRASNPVENKKSAPRVQYGRICGLDKRVSRLVFGCLFLGKTPDPLAMLDAVWAAGCNAFDIAAIYGTPEGQCEKIFGDWMRSRKIKREEVVIVTKGGCRGADTKWQPCLDPNFVQSDLSGSLQRLGVVYIDLYLLHRDDPSVTVESVVNMMSNLVKDRKIKTWGVSNWSLLRLRAAIQYAKRSGKTPPVADSLQMSLAQPSGPVWPGTTYYNDANAGFYEENRDSMAVFGWEALAKGFMAGKWKPEDVKTMEDKPYRERTLVKAYCNERNFARRQRAEKISKEKSVSGLGCVSANQVALAYLLHVPCNAFVLVGTTKIRNFESNLGMFTTGLTMKEARWLATGK